jgi:predicted DNA-binding transcriptional regulator AlpA
MTNIISVDVDDLVTPTQIAKENGLVRSAVFNWIARYPDFPKAVISTPGVRLYSRAAVRRWLAHYGS